MTLATYASETKNPEKNGFPSYDPWYTCTCWVLTLEEKEDLFTKRIEVKSLAAAS